MCVLCASATYAQSTFGNFVGAVTDGAGAAVANARVTLVNVGTAAQRVQVTNATGEYAFNIIDAGTYTVTVEAKGFSKAEFTNMVLLARESKRVDATLAIGSDVQIVEVQGASEGVITTETSSLATTETGEQLVDLPVAIFAHSNGSTSPITTLTQTNPGMQVDDSGGLVIAGATSAMTSVTLDGISSVDVESSSPLDELFPSFNSISEIRVSQTNNNAEYSGVADITTTSRSGTNQYHGGLFENHENTALNARDPFTGSKPKIIMNNFGGFVGGPVQVPRLYNGQDKSFFFASFESLHLPRQTPVVTSVPTLAMRAGNVQSYLQQQAAQGVGSGTIENYDGTALNPLAVPISPVAANIMSTLMPLPNRGGPDSYQNNYAVNFPAPIESNQGDLRLDQTFTPKQSAFLRFSYKVRNVTTAPDPTCTGFCTVAGSPLLGGYSQPEDDLGLTFAHTYVFTPKLINEFRTGFNARRTTTTINISTTGLLGATGLQGIDDPDVSPEAPNVMINGFMVTGGGNPSRQGSGTFQVIDNLTWSKANHTVKVGFDFKRLTDHDDNVFGNYRSGQYTFNGTSTVGETIGDPFTQFLLGYPDYTILATVTNPNMDGLGYSYAWFAQDDWKVTPRLTLNFGLRYELHPPLKEINYDTAAFDPDYTANGANGAVVVPNARALTYTDPNFAASVAPTPILTAAQAKLPEKLRYTALGDWGPRIGFAWRPMNNDKTVIRGGWGNFIESPLGFSLVSGWSVHASFVPYYQNDYDPTSGAPLLSFPSPFPAVRATPGAASFEYAFPIHYKDPSVQQWNLTVEQDLGFGIGLRFSYVGSHGKNLEAFEDLNQVRPNTEGYAAAAANLPFPDWQIIQSVFNGTESNYNAFSAVVNKRLAHGLEFESSYVFTRDLSDAGGANPTAFATAGGNYVSDRFHPGLDYGNVVFDRRHRFLTSGLYTLPFGRGQMFLSGANRTISSILGGWQLGGVLIWQNGPFLTPYEETDDPAGTNMVTTVGYTRPDRVPGVSLYVHGPGNGDAQFLNPAAFTLPGNNIGRFGNASVGSVAGPGTVNTSLSLIKAVSLTEGTRLELGISSANIFNHRNYEPPNMEIDTSSYGQSSELQTAEGAGPRTVQVSGRISF
ncbi:TonB-dependent receptor [Acidipila sp. EB88]|nr:TonB-dependent receptor [Acidipila sp. EB88]